jgi:hypothetical protein
MVLNGVLSDDEIGDSNTIHAGLEASNLHSDDVRPFDFQGALFDFAHQAD